MNQIVRDQRRLIGVIIHGDLFGELLPVDVQGLEAATSVAEKEYKIDIRKNLPPEQSMTSAEKKKKL